MNKKANLLEKAVKREIKNFVSLKLNTPLGPENKFVDFFDVKSAKYTSIPFNKEDRAERINKIKQTMDLSYLDNFSKKTILNRERKGEEREGMVFRRINPVTDINNNIRPNIFSWNTDLYNKRLVGKMIAKKDEQDKSKFI